MATRDISRTSFSRAKRYTDLHAQQGRLFTDADQIEQAEIRAEEARLTRLDVVGPYGSPDDGFRVTGATVTGGQIDFTIGAGTLYLGGHRLERLLPETFRLQSDWLNNPGATPPGAGQVRRDLVVCETWLQPVAASEDAETLEPGLAGPDTSVRLRPVTRVRLVEGVAGETCEEAWEEVKDQLAAAGRGTIDEAFELVPDTRFTIVPLPGSGGDDRCSPDTGAGYLDAENQAIRVAITGDDSFIWGFNNAEPLYKVVLEDDGETIRFLTKPKDALRRPAQNMTVEILPWGAVLENGEKIADESRPGHFALVESGYNPDTQRMTLTPATAVPDDFGTEWEDRSDAAALRRTRYGLSDPHEEYYFLRVWDRGTDTTAGPTLALPAAPATAPLGDTGLAVRVEGNDRRPGDHAIAAARPATPDVVMPWELLVGRAPHGIRRFLAPLALLQWTGDAGEVLSDCRPRFRPLTHMRGCCTYTVGDNNISFGDFDSIQAAIDALPGSGGQVCILPGIYAERVTMLGLENVRLTGCGQRSRLRQPDGDDGPVIDIQGGRNIDIDDLLFETPSAVAIHARGLVKDKLSQPILGLRLRRLDLDCRDRAAIIASFVDRLEISGCRIALRPLERDLAEIAPAGQEPAIFALGDDMMIAENEIGSLARRAVVQAAGGIQIGGGSERVMIRDNKIHGGNGNGITLGHIVMLPDRKAEEARRDYTIVAEANVAYPGGWITIDQNGCIRFTPPGTGDGGGDDVDRERPISGGEVAGVVIRDNHILSMGLTGIATPVAFDPRRGRPVVVHVLNLQVEQNTIRGCAQLETPELPFTQQLYVAFGGIALLSVEVAVFADNRIEANGRSHLDAICGLSVIRAEGLSITGNRIVDNGPRSTEQAAPRPGLRAGIRIGTVQPQSTGLGSEFGPREKMVLNESFAAARALAVPSALIQGNIVHQPLGKALQVMGHGAMNIEGNHLASQGTTTGSLLALLQEIFNAGKMTGMDGKTLLYFVIERLLGTAATVINLGFSSELGNGLALLALLKGGTGALAPDMKAHSVGRQPIGGWSGAARLLQNGEVLFNDNIVIQNFLDGSPSLTLCSVFAMSLDDVSVQDNSMSSQVDFSGDFSLANLVGLGWSVRACGNRFEETLLRSLNSAVTAGIYNDTSHNQGTHCITAIGAPSLLVDGPNRVLAQAFNPLICGGCLTPPFEGLTIVTVDGEVVPKVLGSYEGYTGLDITPGVVISLSMPVPSVSLSVAGATGEDDSVEVVARSPAGEVDRQVRTLDQGPAEFELRGQGIREIVIAAKSPKVLLLTRFCTGRPGLGGGGGAGADFTGATFMTWEGA